MNDVMTGGTGGQTLLLFLAIVSLAGGPPGKTSLTPGPFPRGWDCDPGLGIPA